MHRSRPEPTRSNNEFDHLFAKAIEHQNRGEFDKAVKLYKKLLRTNQADSQTCNNLACALLAAGKLKDASDWFAKSLMLKPQLLQQFGNLLVTLTKVLPFIGAAAER